ncbi:MAG: AAA family ATPase [Pseudomonadota bacterium]
MYEDFYKFLAKPFSLSADAACFFMSPQHAQALAVLQYSLLTSAGLTLVTGESGTGKTLLVRRVMSNLDDTLVIGNIANTHSDFGSILPWVASSLELSTNGTDAVEIFEALERFVDKQSEADKRVVVIIDEAHNLSLSALEELRLLTNLNTSDARGIQFVLVGQPTLEEKLAQAAVHDLAQRIALDFKLEPFDFETTDEYISYRLSLYGGRPELIDYLSRATVYFHSLGIPRLINSLCDLALVYGFGESLETIDIKVVKKVLLSKKVSLSYFNRLQRSECASKLRESVLTSHGIDIARFSAQ